MEKVKVADKPMQQSLKNKIIQDVSKNKNIYIMAIPVVAFYLIFHYVPMYGAIIAFKDYSPSLGILRSPWAGMHHFMSFFTDHYFIRIMKNTIIISTLDIILGFPAPILLALLLNELRSTKLKRTIQTVTYMPHFISLVVVAGMIKNFTSSDGIVNDFIVLFGGTRGALLQRAEMFRPIYIISGIWQEIGWGTIIYLAALSGIDTQLYEAATMDGAGRFGKAVYVTLPGISATILILLILRIGQMFNVGYEKIILLYNPSIYKTADVISTYVYRRGLQQFDWSYSTAVGMFNSIINFGLLLASNKISGRLSEYSLW